MSFFQGKPSRRLHFLEVWLIQTDYCKNACNPYGRHSKGCIFMGKGRRNHRSSGHVQRKYFLDGNQFVKVWKASHALQIRPIKSNHQVKESGVWKRQLCGKKRRAEIRRGLLLRRKRKHLDLEAPR